MSDIFIRWTDMNVDRVPWTSPTPEQIKATRKDLEITQAKMAHIWRVSLQIVKDWESGKYKPSYHVWELGLLEAYAYKVGYQSIKEMVRGTKT